MLPLLLAAAASAAAADRTAYPPRRLAAIRHVTAAEFSPDASRAYVVTDVTGALELWSVPAAGGGPSQLSDLSQQVTEPAVSPDGTRIAFAADHGGDERPDLFIVPAAGGEARSLTVSTRAETSPAWSPDGTKLAFLADPGRPFLFQLMVLDLKSGKELQLTRAAENVKFPVWSPDGKTLAAARSGDDRAGPLLLAAADGGSLRVIPPPVKGGIIMPQSWSPDGARLVTLAEDADGFHRLYLLDPASGKGRFIGPSGWDVEQALWKKDSGLVFSRNEAGASALYRLADPDAALERLTPTRGRIDHFSLDADGASVLFTWSDSSQADDVWRLDLKTKALTPIIQSALGAAAPTDLARGEILSYPSFDGTQIHAVYIRPKSALLGTPPPLVVDVHGGPDWQSYDDFSALRQSLAEAGIAVLAPNFRGSTGFGRKFLDANRKDWGGGDRRDLIEGARFLAKRGDIDLKRVGITGGSYGGYSTLYALARNEGEWAAGVACYGMPDLALDYELSTDRFPDWYVTMMGTPKTDPALFKERSPITYIDKMTAPLLIFQGANDTNVPEKEAHLVHDRLKALGRDVSLIVYPDEGHGFTRRKNLTDFYERTVEFFRSRLASRAPDRYTR